MFNKQVHTIMHSEGSKSQDFLHAVAPIAVLAGGIYIPLDFKKIDLYHITVWGISMNLTL